MPSATLDLVRPQQLWVPEYVDTLGGEVADLCAAYGYAPDPEQRLILDGMFARTRSGKSLRDVGVCAPRQNLKTGVLKQAALGWLFLLDLPLVVWSAHEFDTAQEAFRDMCMLLEDNPDLDREILRTPRGKTGIKRGNGDEAIELRGNRRIKFKARTRDGGRGLTGSRVVLDEAMKLNGATIAALVPTLRAVPDPQLVFAGSGGLLESEVWRSIRDRGRSGRDSDLAWYEWGDQRPWECDDPECAHLLDHPGCALDDADRIRACNPAVGRRISMESLKADRKTFAALPVKYATETLGWWEDPPTEGQVDDVLRGWDAATTINPPTGRLHLGVAVSHDSRGAAIVACDGGTVTVVDYRASGGTTWLGPRLDELRRAHQIAGVARLPGPVTSLDLGDVTTLTGVEAAAASVALAQDVNEGRLLHHRNASADRDPLDVAVQLAVRAFSGDGWRWSLRQSRGDISPLHAAVAARHLASAGPPDYDIEDSAW